MRTVNCNMSKKGKWTRNAEIQLIQEVRERPILWDISHPQYNRTDLKAVYWDKVAEALDSQMTSNLVKERFDNIRTTFMRNERKIKNSTSSGKGSDDIYTPKWDLYPLLTFLRKTTVQATSVSNLDVDTNSTAMSIYCETSESVNIASSIYYDDNLQKWAMIPKDTEITEAEIVPTETPVTPMSSFSEISESTLSSSPSSSCILSQPPSKPCRPASAPASAPANAPNTPTNTKRFSTTESDDMYIKRGRKGSNNSSIMEEAVAAIKDLSKEPPQADAYDHFAAYVAAQLRVLTTEQCAFCEIEIVKILSGQSRAQS